jgi:hypothetical protein
MFSLPFVFPLPLIFFAKHCLNNVLHKAYSCFVEFITYHVIIIPIFIEWNQMLCQKHVNIKCYVKSMSISNVMSKACQYQMLCQKHVNIKCFVKSMSIANGIKYYVTSMSISNGIKCYVTSMSISNGIKCYVTSMSISYNPFIMVYILCGHVLELFIFFLLLGHIACFILQVLR